MCTLGIRDEMCTVHLSALYMTKGIIQVVRGPDDAEEDEELALLRKIQRFEPFIKEQDKGFSIEHLLGLKPKDAKSKDPNKEVQGEHVYTDSTMLDRG